MSPAKQAKKAPKGPPFISDPETIVFRDFVVGETMTIPFTLTNVSFARNTYKVIGFDKEYAAVFNVNFMPPGYVSPGVPVSLSLDFTPKHNTHIVCKLHFLAETGPFDVDVECIPKAVSIQIEPFDVFDIGVVTLGEEVERTVTIRNSGALAATWSVSMEPGISDPGCLTLKEAEGGAVTFNTKHGSVSGYGTSQLKVTFRPPRPGALKMALKFKFSSAQGEFESFVKELPFEAVGADVPVFLEKDRIDLGVCYHNELYRATLVAHNRSNVSQRFVIQMPANLDKFVEFVPKVGFIQPQSGLQITMKLRTSKKFASMFPQFEKTADIPLVMEVVNQVLPVNFTISFTPSPLKLTFEPSSIDFGTLLTTECKEVTVKMTSLMELPCDFGFIRLPQGVSVQPFDGFGLIMPGESIDVVVSFQSQMAKKHEFVVTVATLQGQKFSIPCSANVIATPLQVSETDIQFEATPLGEQSVYKVVLNNTKGSPLDFELERVEDFVMDPVVGTIPANSSLPVYITFKPTVPIQEPEKPPEEDLSATKGKKDLKKVVKGKDKKKPEEEAPVETPTELIASDFTYRLYEKSLSCFYKSGNTTGRHHILLRAAAVLPTLYVQSVVINEVERKSDNFIDLALNKIDFGVVCTGQHMDAVVTIRSMVKRTLTLEYVCERGSFEVLTPVSTIKPLMSAQVRLRFSPSANMQFTSTVTIVCPDRPNNRIVLHLSGQGAAPSIEVSQDTLDFGNVVVGHTITRSLKVKNNANFALEYVYELKPTSDMHTKNMSREEAFTIVKRSQWLKPQESGEATISFSPDHDDPSFRTVLVIAAGEAGSRIEVPVTAAAWPTVMFITGGVEEPQQRTAFDHYAIDEPYFRPRILCELAYPGETAQATLTFGVCSQNEDVKKGNGDLTFDNIQTPGFTVNPQKSGIEAGGSTKVTIEYTPPATSLLQVGQWVIADTAVTVKCADFTRKVPVRIKCLINLEQSGTLSQTQQMYPPKSSRRRNRK